MRIIETSYVSDCPDHFRAIGKRIGSIAARLGKKEITAKEASALLADVAEDADGGARELDQYLDAETFEVDFAGIEAEAKRIKEAEAKISEMDEHGDIVSGDRWYMYQLSTNLFAIRENAEAILRNACYAKW